jgi:uncharacterized protein
MTEESLYQLVASELNLKLIQVKNTIELLDQGNTVPFISRYRKEKTGSLDEEQIRQVQVRVQYLRSLSERKKTVLKSISDQGKLTPELQEKISKVLKLQELEDIYLPYKPKKRTRATIAKEKGLEPLAGIILAQEISEGDPHEIAAEFINPDKGVNNASDAMNGAKDILAEIVSENADIRKYIREYTMKKGFINSQAKSDESDPMYKDYFKYHEPVSKIPAHRILALNRGQKEGSLKETVEVEVKEIYQKMNEIYISNERSIFLSELIAMIEDAYVRLIAPAIHREIRNQLTEKADKHAITVFALNLKKLLLQSPILEKIILGIDPGYRTGCKLAVIDKTGKYLEGTTIYPHPPQKEYFKAKTIIREFVEKYDVDIIAIGNGTASRETELMTVELIKEIKPHKEIFYVVVNEAGASVYSASSIAKEEFPDLEASMRGNISIARRLQDPLAELVKIDPKSLGIGMYQHDINQKKLAETLHDVVESCVNLVGIDVNTASVSLLKYVSGLTAKSAKNIVHFREKMKKFSNREQLKLVDGIGNSAFQQAAGFLRIRGGDNPLDETSIHPESYLVTEKLLDRYSIGDSLEGRRNLKSKIKEEKINVEKLAREIDCGLPTLQDILSDLEKPGRDPREDMPKPIFKSDVLTMEDLREGMVLKGTVRNVVDFGVFVDIGVKQDGLVHVSQMKNKYIKSPHEIVGVGDIVSVKVLSIDLERKRISLSMKDETTIS